MWMRKKILFHAFARLDVKNKNHGPSRHGDRVLKLSTYEGLQS